jgi:hypothetical protein
MSENPPEYSQGWWKAADEKWYPPQRHPDYQEPPVPPSPVMNPAASRVRAEAEYRSAQEQEAQTQAERAGSKLRTIRILGFALLALAALVVTFGTAPEGDAVDVAAARLGGATNLQGTESAFQQQVAIGWETNDLLGIIAGRSVDNRMPLLLMILVFSVAWFGVTLPPSLPSTGRKSERGGAGLPIASDQAMVQDAIDARKKERTAANQKRFQIPRPSETRET